jgi:hypothetical protein
MPWAGYMTPFVYRFRPNGKDAESCVIDFMLLEPVPEGGARAASAPTRYLSSDESWADVRELGVFGRVFNQRAGSATSTRRSTPIWLDLEGVTVAGRRERGDPRLDDRRHPAGRRGTSS